MKLSRSLDPNYFSMFITKEDGFAKTFMAKCKMMSAWEFSTGIINKENELLAAIVTTYGKRSPKIANLQLLHTFVKHRKKGYAKRLCEDSVEQAFNNKCEYFRISSEPEAVGFYKSIGFVFLGRQKSGCQLSIFRLTSPKIEENVPILDSVIHAALYSKKKGGCVEVF
jgi:ribosomal protein S18 acetylase RimI-like enzyme